MVSISKYRDTIRYQTFKVSSADWIVLYRYTWIPIPISSIEFSMPRLPNIYGSLRLTGSTLTAQVSSIEHNSGIVPALIPVCHSSFLWRFPSFRVAGMTADLPSPHRPVPSPHPLSAQNFSCLVGTRLSSLFSIVLSSFFLEYQFSTLSSECVLRLSSSHAVPVQSACH